MTTHLAAYPPPPPVVRPTHPPPLNCHSKVVHGHRHCLLSVQLAGHHSGTVAVALTFKSKNIFLYITRGNRGARYSGVKVTPLCHCHCHSKVVHGHRHCLLSVQLAGHHSGTVAVALTFKSKNIFLYITRGNRGARYSGVKSDPTVPLPLPLPLPLKSRSWSPSLSPERSTRWPWPPSMRLLPVPIACTMCGRSMLAS